MYKANAKKCVILNNNVTVLKAPGKGALADINCYCKMTPVMALDGLTWFFTLERHYKYMLTYATQSNYWWDFFSAMAESWKKLKTSLFIVC